MVLLLLALMWVGAGVYYLRGRPEGRTSDSIGSFRRQLRVLERTGPIVIDPAHRMRDHTTGLAGFAAPSVYVGDSAGRVRASTPSAATLRRRQTQKRRRDVFFGLVLGVVGSFMLGVVPGLRVMWLLAGVLAVALTGYAFLLVQVRNRAAERSMKVRFLPDPGSAEPVLLLRRSAN